MTPKHESFDAACISDSALIGVGPHAEDLWTEQRIIARLEHDAF